MGLTFSRSGYMMGEAAYSLKLSMMEGESCVLGFNSTVPEARGVQ